MLRNMPVEFLDYFPALFLEALGFCDKNKVVAADMSDKIRSIA